MLQASVTDAVAVVEEGLFVGLHLQVYPRIGHDRAAMAVELHGHQAMTFDLRTRPMRPDERVSWQNLTRERHLHPRLQEIGAELRVALLEVQAILQSLPMPGINIAQQAHLARDVRGILGNYAAAHEAELAELTRLESLIKARVHELRHLEARF